MARRSLGGGDTGHAQGRQSFSRSGGRKHDAVRVHRAGHRVLFLAGRCFRLNDEHGTPERHINPDAIRRVNRHAIHALYPRMLAERLRELLGAGLV